MHIKKFITSSFMILIFSLLLSGCNKEVDKSSIPEATTESIEADYPHYENLESIVKTSTDVIRGDIVKDQGIQELRIKDDLDPENDILLNYRIYTIKVTENLKGNLKEGDEIEVKVDQFEEEKELTPDGLYFLETYDDSPASILNPTQGNIPIEEGILQLKEDTKVLFLPKEDSAISRSSHTSPITIEEAAQEIKNLP